MQSVDTALIHNRSNAGHTSPAGASQSVCLSTPVKPFLLLFMATGFPARLFTSNRYRDRWPGTTLAVTCGFHLASAEIVDANNSAQ
jgi:hypothetical protein